MGSRLGDETVELEGTIETSTAKAILWNDAVTGRQEWIPKSQIFTQSTPVRNENMIMTVSEWIAKKNGFI